MDIGIFVGIAVAFGCILLGNALEGGHMGSIVGGPAFLIVIGGTIGAVIVQFPLPQVADSLKAAKKLFKKPGHDAAKLVDEIVEFAQKARKDGVLGLEKVAGTASHPFLTKGLLMAVDGSDSNAIRTTLETVISQEEAHAENSAKVYEAAGGYCPTVGIIGAVLGLMAVMQNLADPSKLGKGIAAAFTATVYGIGFANLLFLPMANKLKGAIQAKSRMQEMSVEGLISIAQGENPRNIETRLRSFVE